MIGDKHWIHWLKCEKNKLNFFVGWTLSDFPKFNLSKKVCSAQLLVKFFWCFFALLNLCLIIIREQFSFRSKCLANMSEMSADAFCIVARKSFRWRRSENGRMRQETCELKRIRRIDGTKLCQRNLHAHWCEWSFIWSSASFPLRTFWKFVSYTKWTSDKTKTLVIHYTGRWRRPTAGRYVRVEEKFAGWKLLGGFRRLEGSANLLLLWRRGERDETSDSSDANERRTASDARSWKTVLSRRPVASSPDELRCQKTIRLCERLGFLFDQVELNAQMPNNSRHIKGLLDGLSPLLVSLSSIVKLFFLRTENCFKRNKISGFMGKSDFHLNFNFRWNYWKGENVSVLIERWTLLCW